MSFADDAAEMNRDLQQEFGETFSWRRGSSVALPIIGIPIFPKDPLALGATDTPPSLQVEVIDADFTGSLAPGPASGDRVVFRGANYVAHRDDSELYGSTVVNLKKL